MTQWPKDGSTLSFEKLTRPVIKAIKFAYDLKRKNEGKDIPWNGPGISKDALANTFDAQERLTAERLAYALEDQGRDALENIITVAIQIGIEQGRRWVLTQQEESAEVVLWKIKARLYDAMVEKK